MAARINQRITFLNEKSITEVYTDYLKELYKSKFEQIKSIREKVLNLYRIRAEIPKRYDKVFSKLEKCYNVIEKIENGRVEEIKDELSSYHPKS